MLADGERVSMEIFGVFSIETAPNTSESAPLRNYEDFL